jgi:NADH-quinone oxidoreductase subunit J
VTITLLFTALAVLSIVGTGGLLVCRQVAHCACSFLLSAVALIGLYLLLNLQFIAAVQLVASAGLVSIGIALGLPATREHRQSNRLLWLSVAALPFIALAYWGITTGTIGEPTLVSPPMWAARGSPVASLGSEFIKRYTIPYALIGLLLLVSIVTATYLLRSREQS